MTTTPHIEAWDTIPRDLDMNDHSRLRGESLAALRAEAERVTNLGNGLTQVTYVDAIGLAVPETQPGDLEA